MPEIRQLPPNLINQIAAGEVIERPASVVKELLENSIDAGARRIEVMIEKGGSELIRISDDGCGMTAEQLPLAIASHATSKLGDDDALFNVQTLGFRGEALASIGSVSHLTIRSRTAESEGGAEIEVRGGTIDGPTPCGCPVGTVMEIRNLFFNTPVRRKFMRTPQTEMGHIVEAFTRIALAHPAVHMTIRSGGRELHDLPPTTNWSERIAAFFGGEIADSLIAVNSDDGQIRVSGYVCDPSVSRGNTRMQYLILNGRHIRDRSLQHALGEAYRGLLMTGRSPVCFLKLELPAEMVDVNVHPTKLEVRFADGGRIYSRVLQTLRHKFLASDLTMRVGPSGGSSSTAASESDGSPSATASQAAASDAHRLRPAAGNGSVLGLSPAVEEAQRQSVIEWARSGGSTPAFRPFGDPRTSQPVRRPEFDAAPPSSISPSSISAGPTSADAISTGSAAPDPAAVAPWEQDEAVAGSDSDGSGSGGSDSDSGPKILDHQSHTHQSHTHQPHAHQPHAGPPLSHLGYQIHDRYLVTQDERGMVVVDQHALHERILYERIREKVLGGSLETQRLLVPEPVSLTPAERNSALDASELLAKVGIEIEPFGGDSVLVRGYPAMLANLGPAEMLRQALESLIAAGKDPEIRDLLDHLLHTIACKAAIKAGDRLTAEEVTSLLEQREMYQDTHHCPHGRPTALFFSRDELDRMFGRLGPRGRAGSR
ncbi:DNA mismatch repair endonuclease MutL [Candidatus Laterigemmans baculatus]|uniref:DNA mismatch repair endonuclease MutL n=1 Tax=Candidatus Laterigemmans baculatus TaxID=2770505 RepID=UPI0013D9B236|nr:DNA mismatch repair endonuclease MutL [Candidatus Laterigemmans baculatus]